MSPRRVAVTGARGYAGSHIAAAIERREHVVIELVRRPGGGSARLQVPFGLDRGVEPAVLRAAGVDALVHAAWDFRPTRPAEIRRVNGEGSIRLFDAFEAAGGGTGVFISTIAAFDGCKSHYGRVKRQVECAALRRGYWVVRPGLIRGDTPGGIVGTMLKLVRKSLVIPILGYGRRVLNQVWADELSEGVARLVDQPPTNEDEALVVLAHPQRLSLDQIVRELIEEKHLGRRLLVPLPWQPVWLGLRAMERLGLSIGLRSDSVISLMNQDPDPPIRPRPWFIP
jgi:nucleoside-diphosphate-sugar epimerase